MSMILLGGALVLMFFVVLSGVTGTTPLDKTYFLRANTGGITGARAVSQWTYFYVCGDGNTNCGAAVPALPFGYAWVGGGAGAPASLLGYVWQLESRDFSDQYADRTATTPPAHTTTTCGGLDGCSI